MKDDITEMVYIMVKKDMEEQWGNRYDHLLSSDVSTCDGIKREIKMLLEKAELPALISVIRNEIRAEIKKTNG